jgi:hypothetical protein
VKQAANKAARGGPYRLLMRGRSIEHLSDPQYDLSAREVAWFFVFRMLEDELGLTPEEIQRLAIAPAA